MAFYLMTYAPDDPYYAVSDEQFMIELYRFRNGEDVSIPWSIQAFRDVRPGDYCYFLSQRCANRGIFGRGRIESTAHDIPGYKGKFVDVFILNYTHYNEPYISLEECMKIRPNYDWTPRNGGRILGKDREDREIGLELNKKFRELGLM